MQQFSPKRGSTPRPSEPGEEKMGLPPRLGLGTINIEPLYGRTDLTIRVWIRSLGMILGKC